MLPLQNLSNLTVASTENDSVNLWTSGTTGEQCAKEEFVAPFFSSPVVQQKSDNYFIGAFIEVSTFLENIGRKSPCRHVETATFFVQC